MKTRTHQHRSPRRPALTSISHRSGCLEAFNSWLSASLWRLGHAVVHADGTGARRSNHLRLVRRNGRPVPVPVRIVVKTRSPRAGRIVAGILLVLTLVSAGIGGSIYLGLHAPAVSLPQ